MRGSRLFSAKGGCRCFLEIAVCALASSFAAFAQTDRGTITGTNLQGEGYDLVLLGRQDSSPMDVDALQRRLDQPAYRGVAASLAEVEFPSAVELLASYTGSAPDLASMLAGVAVNDDWNLRLQYLAGLGLNSLRSAEIHGRLLAYRKFPEDLFAGKGDGIGTLRSRLGRPHRTF